MSTSGRRVPGRHWHQIKALYLLLVTYMPKTPFSPPWQEGRKALGSGASLQEKALPKAGTWEVCSRAGKLGAHQAEAGQMDAQLLKPSPKLCSLCSRSSCAAQRGSEGFDGVRSCL